MVLPQIVDATPLGRDSGLTRLQYSLRDCACSTSSPVVWGSSLANGGARERVARVVCREIRRKDTGRQDREGNFDMYRVRAHSSVRDGHRAQPRAASAPAPEILARERPRQSRLGLCASAGAAAVWGWVCGSTGPGPGARKGPWHGHHAQNHSADAHPTLPPAPQPRGGAAAAGPCCRELPPRPRGAS